MADEEPSGFCGQSGWCGGGREARRAYETEGSVEVGVVEKFSTNELWKNMTP